jgi:hypothetical protein
MPDEKLQDGQPTLIFKRTDDFVSRYSNNCRFETYGSDLKIIFGASDQASGKEIIEQHTAITLSWQQVKLVAYYLQVQLALYEAQAGPVKLHPVVRPQAFPDEVPEAEKHNPRAEETLQFLRTLRERVLKDEMLIDT